MTKENVLLLAMSVAPEREREKTVYKIARLSQKADSTTLRTPSRLEPFSKAEHHL
jgi:hypothetical protein